MHCDFFLVQALQFVRENKPRIGFLAEKVGRNVNLIVLEFVEDCTQECEKCK
jgi:hypothetical protein